MRRYPSRLVLPVPRGTILAPVALTHRDADSREAIVFLHGLGCSRAMWEPILELADEMDARAPYYHLYAMDFPGHGDSPSSPNRTGIIEALLHLERLLESLDGIDRVHLVAHSMATAVLGYDEERTSRWVRRNRIASVIAVEGNLVREDCGLISQRISDASAEEYLRQGGHEAIAAELESARVVTDAAWARQWRRADPVTVWNLARDIVSFSWPGECFYWKGFGPRAYLYGSESDIPAETLALVADSPVYTIAHANHFPMILNPRETLSTILDAIDTVSAVPR